MIFTSKTGLHIAYDFRPALEQRKTLLICLHGFAGSKAEWSFPFPVHLADVSFLFIDLPGFGESEAPDEALFYAPETLYAILIELMDEFKHEQVILAGYSMGGRYALAFAVKQQKLLAGLVLESATPGLKSASERSDRIQADAVLINRIKDEGANAFATYWLSLPLFKTQKNLSPSLREWIRIQKMKNSATGLINSLSIFGTGKMRQLWDDLSSIRVPVLLLSGEYDIKFRQIHEQMTPLFPSATSAIVEHAGHNTHIEKPVEFANLVLSFIQRLGKREFSNVR
jgi:2-succinyl-6-hydroxy-2,4-cyclohexadiene-1-carboxylate synthase